MYAKTEELLYFLLWTAENHLPFKRLNKFLTPLKPQELRNATFMGPFARLAESLADNEYWAENRIITAASIRQLLPNIKETRWSNKTDFYTLFVVLAFVKRPLELSPGILKRLRTALEKFEAEIDLRLADETAKVSKEAVEYVRAAARHAALSRILGEYLQLKSGEN